MPRKKPFSNKQRKAQLQEKRAVKRGDVSPSELISRNPKTHRRPLIARSIANAPAIESSRRLQSAFVKLSSDYLIKSKLVSSTTPLPRPLSSSVAVFSLSSSSKSVDKTLVCPKRPKWRYDMSKKEVEKNEEGLFNKWLDQTDNILQQWTAEDVPDSTSDAKAEPLTMPRAPTNYERNLEVWRQLWRVTEISQILLILLDARCPLIHYPPSLASYLATFQNCKIILVLTKVDISGIDRASAWTAYINSLYPNIRVVPVEAYIQKLNPNESGTSKRYEPHLPQGFRERLVKALKDVHSELLEPPDKIRNDEEKLKTWRPFVKKEIDWQVVLDASGGNVGHVVGGPTVPRPTDMDNNQEDQEVHTDVEPEFLTVGIIGQPNVGKSSLLNALFGAIRVRASKTPGKTKHFQTLFWTSDIRLVDCPGLVMPNFLPMEMQVLSGILPISRISAVAACIHYASQYLPLEKILKLAHPSIANPPTQDKRTWREDRTMAMVPGEREEPHWTAMDILIAYAAAKNWVTAKAGRPDVHRAGNAILRALADGKIRWAFWPPGTNAERVEKEDGIWISGDVEDYESDMESEAEGGPYEPLDGEKNSETESETDSSGDLEEEDVTFGGRFGALALAEEMEGQGTEYDDVLESEDSGKR